MCDRDYPGDICQGGDMAVGFQTIKENGLCSDASAPYDTSSRTCPLPQCKPIIPKGGLTQITNVEPYSHQALQNALKSGPVSVTVDASSMFQGVDVWKNYRSGILPASEGSYQRGNHGVLLVGFYKGSEPRDGF